MEVDAVFVADGAGFGAGVGFVEVNFADPVGAEHLHATGAGFGGAGDEFDVASGEEAAEVDLGMDHEAAACVAIRPEFGGGVVARGEAIVGGADDAVVEVEGDGADFAERVLGAKTGDMGQGHGVFGDGEARERSRGV